MGIGRYAAEMAVKTELKELLEWIDNDQDFKNDPASGYGVEVIREEIQRRFDEPTEG